MISLYELKPRFQALLRPLVGGIASLGITANMVTLAAMAVSVLLGAYLFWHVDQRHLFLLLPAWMPLRMALNAVDGMLAREFGQKSVLGAYLNEISDVVSDAALYLPFVAVSPFGWGSIGAIIFLSAISEMAGILGAVIGAERRYDGPMGKSDRALMFGALGLWAGLAAELPDWAFWLAPAATAALALNVVNRVNRGMKQAQQRGSGKDAM